MFLHVNRLLSPGGSPAPLAYDTSDGTGPVYGYLEVVRGICLASVLQTASSHLCSHFKARCIRCIADFSYRVHVYNCISDSATGCRFVDARGVD